MHGLLHRLVQGNMLFAIKAAILSVLIALPAFFKSSARFSYVNKG